MFNIKKIRKDIALIKERKKMKFNFIVRATAWGDHDTWEADFIPMWFDDETKKKINEVIIQGYNRYKHKRKDRDKHKD